jgi:Fur family transcriptional regulator, peroxide stress response regulator
LTFQNLFAGFYFFLHTIFMTSKKIESPDLTALLRSAGLKVTEPRITVLTLLANAGKPLTVQGIQKQLRRAAPDQATLYRMLSLLKDAGTIRQVNLEHPHAHYEFGSIHHHHAICERCGVVIDISACNIKPLEAEVKRIARFNSIKHHSLEFFGICNTCAKKK